MVLALIVGAVGGRWVSSGNPTQRSGRRLVTSARQQRDRLPTAHDTTIATRTSFPTVARRVVSVNKRDSCCYFSRRNTAHEKCELDTTQRLANATPVLLQQGLTRSQSSGETFGKIDMLKAIGHARNSGAFTAAHAAKSSATDTAAVSTQVAPPVHRILGTIQKS